MGDEMSRTVCGPGPWTGGGVGSRAGMGGGGGVGSRGGTGAGLLERMKLEAMDLREDVIEPRRNY